MIRDSIEFNEDFKLDWHDPDEATDGYQLKWIGKDYARLQAGTATETIIVPDTNHNKQKLNENSENIFFTGDNLDVLKHLQNAYSNSIKVIYTDPPYNTKKEFTYSDNFEFSDEQLKNMLGLTDDEIKRLHSINGRSSHSAWLTFMYPRLKIAKKLLTDDGVMFISIDDNEYTNLKQICNEIFGEDNTEVLVWKKVSDDSGKLKITYRVRNEHEYIIVCYKDKRNTYFNKFIESRNYKNEYTNPDNDPRGPYKQAIISDTEENSNTDSECYYSVTSPSGKVFTRQWRVEEWEMKELIEDNRIFFGLDGNSVPALKAFINEPKLSTPCSVLENLGTAKTAGAEIEELFGSREYFLYPKPVNLVKHLIKIATQTQYSLNPQLKSPRKIFFPNADMKVSQEVCTDTVLDFFAGSATTAHAVMQLNAEENGGKRNFIMVQLPEILQDDTKAKKEGFSTIDEISRKRIEAAANKIKKETKADIDYGFKHYAVKNAEINTISKIIEFNPETNFIGNEDMVREFDSDKSNGEAVILTTWLVDDGYKLDIEPEIKDFCGYKAYYIDNSTLYLISQGWGRKQTEELLNLAGNRKMNLNTIILYGYSFDFESLKELETNVKQNLNKAVNIEKRY